MFNVHQNWDPLRTCMVGSTVPPEYFSWITQPRLRNLFERMVIETEDGFQLLIKKLQELGVQTVRPNVDLKLYPYRETTLFYPPVQPRSNMMMVGDKFYYQNWSNQYWKTYYTGIADPSWDNYSSVFDFLAHAPAIQVNEMYDQFNLEKEMPFFTFFNNTYGHVIDLIEQQGNQTIEWEMADGGLLTVIGQDLYFGTSIQDRDLAGRQTKYDCEFPNYRNHMIDSLGHTDGMFCAVRPGLIVAHDDPNCVIDYGRYFPGWEIIYVRNNSPMAIQKRKYKEFFKKTNNKWWLEGHENDHELINLVESSFTPWIGSSGESVFDVNMLVVDAKNIITNIKNDRLNTILEKYGITVHVLDMPHIYFWDGGVHCMTVDLDRGGQKQDYFPSRA